MIQVVRGTRDILPEETSAWQFLEATARRVFSLYGYREIRTPLFERTELFARAVGETTDIVEKEMYTFADRGGDSLTLRPEGTAGVVRCFVENSLERQLPWRVWYGGPMFRYERPQKGRYRQFHQIGAELFGPEGPLADAELMAMVLRFLREAGLAQQVTLEINSLGCPVCRPPYREKLTAFLLGAEGQLCQHCRQRLGRNPLRVLDCKDEGCREVARRAPAMKDHLCVSCADHFQGVQGHLTDLAAPFTVNPLMVRGLDYYTRTAFEATTTALGAQNAVAAGGRYDGLVGEMGGASVPAIGFAMGVERLVLLLGEQGIPGPRPDVYLVALGEGAVSAGLVVAEALRSAGVAVESHPVGSFKSQMKKADRSRAPFTAIIGADEAAQGKLSLKEMESGEQTLLTVAEAVERLKRV